MPSQFTVGGVSRLEDLANKVRDLMIGMGFQEMIANIMGSRHDFCTRMRMDGTEWAHLVEVDNVMTQNYACLRQWILPSLVAGRGRLESSILSSSYLRSRRGDGSRFPCRRRIAHGDHAGGDDRPLTGQFLRNPFLSRSCCCITSVSNTTWSHSSILHFSKDELGRIVSDGQIVGLLGEVHPEVLEHWQSAFLSLRWKST